MPEGVPDGKGFVYNGICELFYDASGKYSGNFHRNDCPRVYPCGGILRFGGQLPQKPGSADAEPLQTFRADWFPPPALQRRLWLGQARGHKRALLQKQKTRYAADGNTALGGESGAWGDIPMAVSLGICRNGAWRIFFCRNISEHSLPV